MAEQTPEDERELKDLLAEESSRGKKQPKKAISLARQRTLRRLADLLRDPRCDQETYLEVIHELGLQEDSDKYRQLLALWRKRRGND